MTAPWNSKRLKFAAASSRQLFASRPETMRYIGLENIESGTGKLLLETEQEQVDSTVVAFDEHSVLLGKLRPYLAKVATPDFRGVASTEIMVFFPMDGNDRRFLSYTLLSDEFIKRISAMVDGAKMPRANPDDVLNLRIFVPPPTEQRRVAWYLDEQTAKIDRLMELRRRQMELLQEQRAALIQEAVTRGLDSTADLKDSGIADLGNIPRHWRSIRIAVAVSKMSNGYVGPTRDILCEEGVRYIQSLHVKSGRIIFDTPYYVPEQWSEKHSRSILRTGDVLVVQTGACTGQFALVQEDFDGTNCHALIILRMKPKYGSGRYLSLLFSSVYGQDCLMRERTGALHPHLECGKLRDVQIPIPPIDEQNKILTFVRETDATFDSLYSGYARQLTLLSEYRAALIHECVTGQRPVFAAQSLVTQSS